MCTAVPISISALRRGGSSFTAKEQDGGLLLQGSESDHRNFNLIVRRLINEPTVQYSVFPRSDGQGGYDSVYIVPHETSDPTA
jgi:hypothetical protein